jgi:hypothetical protein
MTVSSEIIAGLLTGLSREVARQLDKPVSQPVCRHAAWYIAVGGYALTYEQIGKACTPPVSKQAVGEACARMADLCDDRAFERNILRVADTFGVSL